MSRGGGGTAARHFFTTRDPPTAVSTADIQIIFAVENSEALSAVAQNLLASVTAAIALLEADGDGGWNNQYALILYDDKGVEFLTCF